MKPAARLLLGLEGIGDLQKYFLNNCFDNNTVFTLPHHLRLSVEPQWLKDISKPAL